MTEISFVQSAVVVRDPDTMAVDTKVQTQGKSRFSTNDDNKSYSGNDSQDFQWGNGGNRGNDHTDNDKNDKSFNKHNSDGMQIDSTENTDEELLKKKRALDKGSRERGKRFMGVLLGTLNRFKKESANSAGKDLAKKEREAQIADKIQAERNEIQNSIREDRIQRRIGQVNNRIEQEKKALEEMKSDLSQLLQAHSEFLKTETSPGIFYRPFELTESQETLLQKQRDSLDELWNEKVKGLSSQLDELIKQKQSLEAELKNLKSGLKSGEVQEEDIEMSNTMEDDTFSTVANRAINENDINLDPPIGKENHQP